MQIDSPFKGKEPTEVRGDTALYYTQSRKERVVEYVPVNPNNPNAGIRAVEKTITIPLDGESVDINTGESDTKYWQPDTVLDPTGCNHRFKIIDVGQREIQCESCGFATTIHLGINFKEANGVPKVRLQDQWYVINPS